MIDHKEFVEMRYARVLKRYPLHRALSPVRRSGGGIDRSEFAAVAPERAAPAVVATGQSLPLITQGSMSAPPDPELAVPPSPGPPTYGPLRRTIVHGVRYPPSPDGPPPPPYTSPGEGVMPERMATPYAAVGSTAVLEKAMPHGRTGPALPPPAEIAYGAS